VVWAFLFVSNESKRDIETFLLDLGIQRDFLHPRLHLTVYHARRRIPGLKDLEENCRLDIVSSDLRFMAMAPGGENPRSNIDPSACNLGVRVRRNSTSAAEILALRARFYPFETDRVLGERLPSSSTRNAFGARHSQPHITLLRPGNGVDRDLTKIGTAFRCAIKTIVFDRFVVKCRFDF
jgi:hypothetical protein